MGRTEAKNCKHDGSSQALPDEILVDILSRVSAEDLARCNCVSKLWNHSLTIQAFMLRYSCSSEATNGNTLTTFDPLSSIPHEPIKILSFEIPKQKTPVNIVRGHVRHLPKFVAKFVRVSNIYHGLACFFNHSIKSFSELSIVLYNIRTNDLITLPKTPNYDMLNPSEIVKGTSSSIGFDTLRKEYIIFRMTSIETTTEQKYRTSYKTLTLGSGPWKQIDDNKVPLSLSRGVRHINIREFCLDGVIYWIHGSEPEPVSLEATFSVGTFDLSQEEFRSFDSKNILPECSFGRVDPCHLASLRGCPCHRDTLCLPT